MKGIQFISDATGCKMAAIIDLKKPEAVREDIRDVWVSGARRPEKRALFEKVKTDLIASGKHCA